MRFRRDISWNRIHELSGAHLKDWLINAILCHLF